LPLSTVCIYCGGYTLAPQKFKAAAQAVGSQLAQRGFQIVFGGSKIGLMGAVADAALAAGGKVIGIMPEFLRSIEFQHLGVSESHVVPDLHTRKRMMIERSDAFLVLPGGLGTLDETFEIITWKKLKLHNKPIILFNQDGYWNELVALIDKTIDEGFSKPEEGEPWFQVAHSIDEIFALLAEPTGPQSSTLTGRM